MKPQEFIPEYEISPRTERMETRLRDLGYRRLGYGADKTVWTRDDANVVGILMPTSGEVSDAKKSLLALMKLKERYPNNVHLPRFVKFRDESGREEYYKEFKFDGRSYLQFGVERLQPIRDPNLLRLIGDIRVFASTRKHFGWDAIWMRLKSTNDYLKTRYMKPHLDQIEPSMRELWQTMQYIIEHGESLGLFVDGFHGGNVLQRNDGTPVIMDPYYYRGDWGKR